MKKKKWMSALLTAVLVLGSAVGVPAATGTEPSAADTADVTVYGVEEGVTVTAYHLISAVYDEKGNGLTGYEVADGVEIEDIESPTAEEITEITRAINDGTLTISDREELEYQSDGTYTASLTAGMWLILVSDAGDTVYNPMILSNWYSDANDASSLQAGAVDAEGNFVEGEWSTDDDGNDVYSGTAIYAKSTTTTITKVITDYENGNDYGTDGNVGDEVSFLITTQIPDYSDAYDDGTLQFIITDTLSYGLSAIEPSDLTITVGGTVFLANGVDSSGAIYTNYTITTTPEKGSEKDEEDQTIVISFSSDFILEHIKETVTVAYTTTIDEDALMAEEGPNPNAVSLTYTNEYSTAQDGTLVPGTTTSGPKYVYVYTFALTDEFVKVSPGGSASSSGTDVSVTKALSGASFTVCTDEDCTQVYTNDIFDGTAVSDENGCVSVEGLAEGTYYLTETEAPSGYYINDTVYKLVIYADYNSDGTIANWNISITDDTGSATQIRSSDYTVSYTSDGSEVTAAVNATAVVDSVRQKLPDTGDIGNLLFIVLSCSILGMAVLLMRMRKKPS